MLHFTEPFNLPDLNEKLKTIVDNDQIIYNDSK